MHKYTVMARKATSSTSVNVPKTPVSVIYGSTASVFVVVTIRIEEKVKNNKITVLTNTTYYLNSYSCCTLSDSVDVYL